MRARKPRQANAFLHAEAIGPDLWHPMRVRAGVTRRSRGFTTIQSQNTGAHGCNIRVQAITCPNSEVERQATGPNAREPPSGVPLFREVLCRKIDLILVAMRHWRFGKKGVRGKYYESFRQGYSVRIIKKDEIVEEQFFA